MSARALHQIIEQVSTAGYLTDFVSFEMDSGASIRGYCRPELIDKLKQDKRFCCGPWHLLHADVGEPRVEFRSHTGSLGKGSLQIVINTETDRYYMDLDRFSPYSDLVGVFGHLFGEVVPWPWKRKKSQEDA